MEGAPGHGSLKRPANSLAMGSQRMYQVSRPLIANNLECVLQPRSDAQQLHVGDTVAEADLRAPVLWTKGASPRNGKTSTSHNHSTPSNVGFVQRTSVENNNCSAKESEQVKGSTLNSGSHSKSRRRW